MRLTKFTTLVPYHHLKIDPPNPHKLVREYMDRGNKVWEIAFNTKTSPLGIDNNDDLYKSENVAIMFCGGRGKHGLIANRFYVVVDEKIFERMNYNDISHEVASSGLKTIRNKKLIYYLRLMNMRKKDFDAIMSSAYEDINERT